MSIVILTRRPLGLPEGILATLDGENYGTTKRSSVSSMNRYTDGDDHGDGAGNGHGDGRSAINFNDIDPWFLNF